MFVVTGVHPPWEKFLQRQGSWLHDRSYAHLAVHKPCAPWGQTQAEEEGIYRFSHKQNRKKKQKTKSKSTLARASIAHPAQRHVRHPAGHTESPEPLGGLCKIQRSGGHQGACSHWPGALARNNLHFPRMKWEAALSSRNCMQLVTEIPRVSHWSQSPMEQHENPGQQTGEPAWRAQWSSPEGGLRVRTLPAVRRPAKSQK